MTDDIVNTLKSIEGTGTFTVDVRWTDADVNAKALLLPTAGDLYMAYLTGNGLDGQIFDVTNTLGLTDETQYLPSVKEGLIPRSDFPPDAEGEIAWQEALDNLTTAHHNGLFPKNKFDLPASNPIEISLEEILTGSIAPGQSVYPNRLKEYLKGLMIIAETIVLPDPGGEQAVHPYTGQLTPQMVQQIDQLIQSLEAAGVITSIARTSNNTYDNIPDPQIPLNQPVLKDAIRAWQLQPGAEDTLDKLIALGTGTRLSDTLGAGQPHESSLQQMIRFEYVQRGNDLIFDAMQELHDNLKLIEQTIGVLNTLQDLLNQKDPKTARLDLQKLMDIHRDRQGFAVDYDTDVDGSIFGSGDDVFKDSEAYVQQLHTWEASQFDRELTPIMKDPAVVLEAFNSHVGDPVAEADLILGVSITLIDDLLAGFEDVGLTAEDTPLIRDLEGVRNDLVNANSLEAYVEDYVEGDLDERSVRQRHLNTAIVTAQSLNDSQKEQLRRRMFEFEEFYKSASGMIHKITQIIEKIAQGIRG